VARAVYKKDAPPPPKPAPQTGAARVFWMYVAAAGVLACGFVDFPLLAYHFQTTALAKPRSSPCCLQARWG